MLFVPGLVSFINIVLWVFLSESSNLQMDYLFLICFLTISLEVLNLKFTWLCFWMGRKAYIKNNIDIKSKLEEKTKKIIWYHWTKNGPLFGICSVLFKFRLLYKCPQSWNLCHMAKIWPTPEQATGQPSRWTWEIPPQDALIPCPAAERCILQPLFLDGKLKTSVYLGLLFHQMLACNNYLNNQYLNGFLDFY